LFIRWIIYLLKVKSDRERASFAFTFTEDFQAAAHHLAELLGDGEPKSRTTEIAIDLVCTLLKRIAKSR
jgi:hypothetical protein